jgi:hypothetical protein
MKPVVNNLTYGFGLMRMVMMTQGGGGEYVWLMSVYAGR